MRCKITKISLNSVLPYFLLVSFFTGNIKTFDMEKIKSINQSPYDGVAVELINAYDISKPTEKDFESSVNYLKAKSKKSIWPWVYFNRFIGYKDGERTLAPAKIPYFQAIRGMDVYNERGALEDFYNLWRISLRIAKRLGSPGIFVDTEAYNNYRAYELTFISRELNKPEVDIKARLMDVGSDLADIVEAEYPQATLWFTFSGLGQAPEIFATPAKSGKSMTVAYIVKGILDRAKLKKYRMTLVSGGMLSLGYCYESLDDMKARIKQHKDRYREALVQYPNLALAGTIAPWSDASLKQPGYFTSDKCGRSTMKNLGDFKPLITEMMKSYSYVWVYAAMMVGYDPYDHSKSAEYNRSIGEVVDTRK